MAICLKGMNEEETLSLTEAIAGSGDTVDLSEFGSLAVDKHSTGGVGDKTTLIVAPIVAAAGCKVAKMSGRGLGHTGGTIDKLESFPGYNTEISPEEFFKQVREIGIAVTGQTGNLAPADKKIYALRDVTATVDSIPLIASSVMGKKLASGAGAIVLDVKYGSGAFMKDAEAAEKLAEAMVRIGKGAGRKIAALVTNMDEPLGRAVGNVIEVEEAIFTLKGEGPADLTELSLALAAAMISLAKDISYDEAGSIAEDMLKSGAAYKKFIEWIGAQGGDTAYAKSPELFPNAEYTACVASEHDGYISHINAELVGLASVELGAGRREKGDKIDHTAGIYLNKKCGERVAHGDCVATLYASDEEKLAEAMATLKSAIEYSDEKGSAAQILHGILR